MTWDGWYSILPVIATVASTIASILVSIVRFGWSALYGDTIGG